MRKTFRGYYRPTEEEFTELWETCLFVPDTNVLLNLYRYSSKTREAFIDILTQIADRLWIPHQVGREYLEQRPNVIAEQVDIYNKVQRRLQEALESLEGDLRSSFRGPPSAEIESLLEKIKKTFAVIKEELDTFQQEYPYSFDSDSLRDTITTLFEGKVGSPYSLEELDGIYKKGKIRYGHKIPPGYEDQKKEKNRKNGDVKQYGDLILWFQIIDAAKKENKAIILVTDDRKEDYWWKSKGKTIGPRPELIQEMFSEAGVLLYMYLSDQFMKWARKYLKRHVDQEVIDEVRDVRQRDEEYIRALKVPISFRIPSSTIRAIQQLMASPRILEQAKVMQQAMQSPGIAAQIRAIQQAMESPYNIIAQIQAMQQATRQLKAMGFRFPDEATEDTTEVDDSLDTEQEEEIDEPDDQSDARDD